MKPQAFFELVGKMMTAQADYYATSKKFGPKSQEAIAAIAKTKGLEKQVWEVIKDGKLETEEPTMVTHVYTTEEYQRQLELLNASDLQMRLDFPGIQRPTEWQGEKNHET